MSNVTESIDVDVPVRTAYNQWTQFEEFPQFMNNVKQIRQLDDTHLEWTAEIAGKEKVWQATVTEQNPDERVAWMSDDGSNAGVVTFHRIDENVTRVTVQMDIDPEGVVENVGDALGVPDRSVKGDLKRFKEFIESRGTETGAYRGEVEQTSVS